jgi:hypothetical protein
LRRLRGEWATSARPLKMNTSCCGIVDGGGTSCRFFASRSRGAELALVVEQWPALRAAVRERIVALVRGR